MNDINDEHKIVYFFTLKGEKNRLNGKGMERPVVRGRLYVLCTGALMQNLHWSIVFLDTQSVCPLVCTEQQQSHPSAARGEEKNKCTVQRKY